jgi:hypothetical protein
LANDNDLIKKVISGPGLEELWTAIKKHPALVLYVKSMAQFPPNTGEHEGWERRVMLVRNQIKNMLGAKKFKCDYCQKRMTLWKRYMHTNGYGPLGRPVEGAFIFKCKLQVCSDCFSKITTRIPSSGKKCFRCISCGDIALQVPEEDVWYSWNHLRGEDDLPYIEGNT